MNKPIYKLCLLLALTLWACGSGKKTRENKVQEVNIYTHRHYAPDQELFAKFEKETGIKVNVVNASADELIMKMENEGTQSPADVLITVDAGRLERAKEKGLLQPVNSEVLSKNVPAHLQDTDKQWFGLTKRARVIAYAKDRIDPSQFTTYEDLADPKWKGKILIRSSGNIYNQSLMASIIANLGEKSAFDWAAAIVGNMAREPRGNDRDQMKAVIAGEGDLAIVNTYYLGKMHTSTDPEEVAVAEKIAVFFPNQNGRGTHINVSGAGVAKHSPNKDHAIKFIEYLSSAEAQKVFCSANFEYPVNPYVEIPDLLKSWGTFKEDKLPLSKLGELNKEAVLTFDKSGWK